MKTKWSYFKVNFRKQLAQVVALIAFALPMFSPQAQAITSRVHQDQTVVTLGNSPFWGMTPGNEYHAEIDFNNALLSGVDGVVVRFYHEDGTYVSQIHFRTAGYRQLSRPGSWWDSTGTHDFVRNCPALGSRWLLMNYHDQARVQYNVDTGSDISADVRGGGQMTFVDSRNGQVLARVRYRVDL